MLDRRLAIVGRPRVAALTCGAKSHTTASDAKRLEIAPPAGQDRAMFDQCAHRVPTRRSDAIGLANRSNSGQERMRLLALRLAPAPPHR